MEHRYLIIGGSTKCGTTSVFKYFEYHPLVCPCTMKESRYFWDDAYPLSAASRQHDKIKSFASLFRNCKTDQVRFEATPDYLYSAAAAKKIHDEIPGCKIVFLLREPVSRLISWYKFAKINGLIPPQQSFEEYVHQQENTDQNTPQHLRALEQGNYASHIQNYFQLFGSSNIMVGFYENLVANPKQLCAQISDFVSIDPNYFNHYDFKIFNKTVSAKSVAAHQLFRKFKRGVRPVTRLLHPAIRKKLKLAGHKLETGYQQANRTAEHDEIKISSGLAEFLESYYKNDRIALQKLLTILPPWKH